VGNKGVVAWEERTGQDTLLLGPVGWNAKSKLERGGRKIEAKGVNVGGGQSGVREGTCLQDLRHTELWP